METWREKHPKSSMQEKLLEYYPELLESPHEMMDTRMVCIDVNYESDEVWLLTLLNTGYTIIDKTVMADDRIHFILQRCPMKY